MKINFILGSALLLSQPLCAQNEEAKDTLTAQMMMQNLPEVFVKATRPIVKAERGQLVYNMPLLIEKMPADNAYDALTRIPGVNELNGNINYAGKELTLIINGKPTTLNYAQLAERLKAMPASQLAKAEVMLAAPARLHVRGMVINLVTKDYVGKNLLSGQIQSIWSQSKYGEGEGKGNLLFQKGKFGLDAMYSFTDGTSYGETTTNANHPLQGKRVAYHDKTSQKTLGLTHNYRLGLSYAFADNHQLSLAYTGKWDSSHPHHETMGTGTSQQQGNEHTYLHNVDASYNLPFGLQIGISYLNYQNPSQQYLAGTMLDEERILYTNSKQVIDKWLFTADQSHSLKKGWELSYGMKFQNSNNRSYQATTNKDGADIPDATSQVNIEERILSFYGGISKQINERISLEASVEAEQYHSPQWNKWHIYPTLNASWKANPGNILNLSFSSSSQFPSYWSTMSSIYYASTYMEIWGNPHLKPYSTYETNLMWTIKSRHTLMAFAEFQPNYSVQLPYQTTDHLAVIMKETNFDYNHTIGIRASTTFGIGNWMNGSVSATGIYRHDKSNDFFDLPFNRKHISAILAGNLSAQLSRSHHIHFILNPFYQSKAIQGLYDIKSVFLLNAMLRWASDNDKWSIVVKGSNIFNEGFSTKSVQGNQDYHMNIKQDWTSASISIICKIGKYKEKRTKDVDTSRMGVN